MIQTKSNRYKAIPPEAILLIALRYYASGSFLINVGDHSGIHVSTTSKIVNKVSAALGKLSEHYIYRPTSQEDISSVKRG